MNVISNQNNSFTNNFFWYLSQKIDNNIINYLQIQNINNHSNNQFSNGNEQITKNEIPSVINLFNLGINDNNNDIYQIKKIIE